MKLPFRTLTLLLLFLVAPVGLMKLTNRAIETTVTYPLMSTAPSSGYAAFRAVGHSLHCATTPSKLAIAVLGESVLEYHDSSLFSSYLQANRDDWLAEAGRFDLPIEAQFPVVNFEPIVASRDIATSDVDLISGMDLLEDVDLFQSKSESIPGLLRATGNALNKSWSEWQPTFVALPDRIEELRQKSIFSVLRRRAENYVAMRTDAMRTPLATTTPMPTKPAPMIELRNAAVARTVFTSVIKQLSTDALEFMVPAKARLATQAIRVLPNPAIRVSRLTDAFKSTDLFARALVEPIGLGVDNR